MRGISKAKLLYHQTRTRLGCVRWHGGPSVSADSPRVTITFIQSDGSTRIPVQAIVGETILQTAHRNEIELEGACEGGTCALKKISFVPSSYLLSTTGSHSHSLLTYPFSVYSTESVSVCLQHMPCYFPVGYL
jgi:ferredoxin